MSKTIEIGWKCSRCTAGESFRGPEWMRPGAVEVLTEEAQKHAKKCGGKCEVTEKQEPQQ